MNKFGLRQTVSMWCFKAWTPQWPQKHKKISSSLSDSCYPDSSVFFFFFFVWLVLLFEIHAVWLVSQSCDVHHSAGPGVLSQLSRMPVWLHDDYDVHITVKQLPHSVALCIPGCRWEITGVWTKTNKENRIRTKMQSNMVVCYKPGSNEVQAQYKASINCMMPHCWQTVAVLSLCALRKSVASVA